jgi:N6-adenosine-specific RNA methylase IME4
MMPALQRRKLTPANLVYPTMSIEEIRAMPVAPLAAVGAHLWLWIVNQFLREAFDVMEAWGFKYLQTITWVKNSGCGNYFISQTEHCLFGYKNTCQFNRARYIPNVYHWPRATAGNHSRKPTGSYELIESVSDEPRLELFARPISPMFPKIEGWDTWGNEMEPEVDLTYHANN